MQMRMGLGISRVGGAGLGSAAAQRIIWDTDLDSDCDDIAATALLCALVALDECQLIAATTASNNTEAAPTMRALLDYAGLTSVPVGAYQGSSIGGGSTSPYTTGIRDAFRVSGETRSTYDDAVTVLRQALADAPDGSVKIVTGGTLTNIAALLASAGDGISALDGADLVAAKVSEIHVMAGNFSGSVQENNVFYDIAAAQSVATSSPVPVYWSGGEVGGTVYTSIPSGEDPATNPFKLGWDLSSALLTGGERQSWDLFPVITAVRGTAGGILAYSAVGNVAIADTTGYSTHTNDAGGNDRIISKVATDGDLETYLNGILTTYFSALVPPVYTATDWLNLKSWWDPEDAATVFSDSAGTTAATVDVDSIGRILDKKGTNHLQQATSGNRPTYITDALASRKAVKFTSASSQRLSTSGVSGRDVSWAGGNDQPNTMVSAIRRGSLNTTPLSFYRSSTSYDIHRFIVGSTGNPAVSRISAGLTVTADTAQNVLSSDVWFILVQVFNGTQVTVRINGTTLGTYALNANSVTFDEFSMGAYFQQPATWLSHFNGAVGETFVSNDNRLNPFIISMEQALATKYGVTLA